MPIGPLRPPVLQREMTKSPNAYWICHAYVILEFILTTNEGPHRPSLSPFWSTVDSVGVSTSPSTCRSFRPPDFGCVCLPHIVILMIIVYHYYFRWGSAAETASSWILSAMISCAPSQLDFACIGRATLLHTCLYWLAPTYITAFLTIHSIS